MRIMSRTHARLLLAVLVLSLVLSALLAAVFDRVLHVDVEGVVSLLRNSGPWAPMALVGLMIVAVVVPPVPSVPLDIAAGVVFGLGWGVVWVLIGAEAGAVMAFLLARRLGRGWVQRKVQPQTLERVDRLVEERGFWGVLVMRLLPTFHFDWVSYAAGLSSMRLAPFAAATAIGMLAPVTAIVAVGDQLLSNPHLAAWIFGSLLALVLVPLVWLSFAPQRR